MLVSTAMRWHIQLNGHHNFYILNAIIMIISNVLVDMLCDVLLCVLNMLEVQSYIMHVTTFD